MPYQIKKINNVYKLWNIKKKIFVNINYKSKETIGIIFAIIAYFSFSILDTIQKSAVLYYSIFQLLLIIKE